MTPQKLIPIILIFLLTGCVMLPSVQSLHQRGYEKLIVIIPDCMDVKGGGDNYSACMYAAEILESSSPQQATAKFISSWEKTSFGLAERKQHAGETVFPLDPAGGALDAIVWGKIRSDDIRAYKKIVLPVIQKIYSDNIDDYSIKMLKQTNLIIVDSRSSLDSFQAIHTKLLIE